MKNAFCSRLATRIRERRYTAHDAARLFWICYLSLVAVYCLQRTAKDIDNHGEEPESTGPATSSMEDICDFLPDDVENVPDRVHRVPPASVRSPGAVIGDGLHRHLLKLRTGTIPVAAGSGE